MWNLDTNRNPARLCAVQPSAAHTYSFAVIVVQRGVLIVWAGQCREVLVMDGEILCLFS